MQIQIRAHLSTIELITRRMIRASQGRRTWLIRRTWRMLVQYTSTDMVTALWLWAAQSTLDHRAKMGFQIKLLLSNWALSASKRLLDASWPRGRLWLWSQRASSSVKKRDERCKVSRQTAGLLLLGRADLQLRISVPPMSSSDQASLNRQLIRDSSKIIALVRLEAVFREEARINWRSLI